MKKPNIIYLLIISCIVFVFTNTYLVFNYISKTDKEIEQINKIYAAVSQSRSLLSLIKDAEIGQRGYLITQDNLYLAPYFNAKKNLNLSKRDFFKSTVSLSYISSKSLIEIDSLTDKKIREIDFTINLVKQSRVEEALAIIKTNEGKFIMDSIRFKINSIKSLTEQHISSLQTSLENKRKELKYFIYIFNSLVICTLITFTLRLRNRDRKIANLIKSVTQQKNEVNLLAFDLQEQNEKLLKYSHILSHDLKSPIQNFKAIINLYEEEKNPDEKLVLFELLKKQCDDMSLKVHELIDELKLIQYKKEERKGFDVRLLVEKVLIQFQHEIYTSKIKLSLNIPEKLILEGTGTYLESIVQNLISNAIKYRALDRECFITISASDLKDKIQISVEDNGLGIDLEKHSEHLFKIYETFHEHPDAKGVGLHLVKKLVNNLGGEIGVESKVNVGSKFTLTFPKK